MKRVRWRWSVILSFLIIFFVAAVGFMGILAIELSVTRAVVEVQKALIGTQQRLIEELLGKQNDEEQSTQPITLTWREKAREVLVTAYTASEDECDSDPEVTASLRRPRPGGTVAVSRDLFYSGWVFGKKVYIEGVGIYEINDLMNARHNCRVDVFMGTKKQAWAFGTKVTRAILVK